ncbi:MAG: hypothetical protein ACI4KG_05120 [Oscillospiraceae bacterium]
MNSKSARQIAILFAVLGIVAGIIGIAVLNSVTLGITLGLSLLALAIIFLMLEGILKHQEELISTVKELKENQNESLKSELIELKKIYGMLEKKNKNE